MQMLRKRIYTPPIRFYSSQKETESTNAIKERFSQILQSKLDNSTITQIQNNPELHQIYHKYNENTKFKDKYQNQLLYLKSEKVLQSNKHAKELADTSVTKPWKGTESVYDSNLRMILDTKPKQLKIITPPTPKKQRIHNAMESSLDYKLSKVSIEQKEPDDDNFKELYKERLLGPSVFMGNSGVSTLGLISSMADVKINQQLDKGTGKFKSKDMENVRGKPLSKEHLANATDTNYFMNQILQKQDCLPPWIESQKGVDKDIERLKFNLDKDWSLHVIHKLSKNFKFIITQETVEHYQKEQAQLIDANYHQEKLKYLTPIVKDINLRITTYNLSSPSSNLHKWKLVPEAELNKSYQRVLQNLALLAQQHNEKLSSTINSANTPPPSDSNDTGFLSTISKIFS